MKPEKIRKTDRRTLYTINVIKDAVLELMKYSGFNDLTVTAVCKQAEITRSTFYIHFDNLSDILNELIRDALNLAENCSEGSITDTMRVIGMLKHNEIPKYLREHTLDLPPCQRIADNEKYRVLFKDESIASYITKTIFLIEKEYVVPQMMKELNLSEDKCLFLFLFNINGAYALNKYVDWKKDDAWYDMQAMLLSYISGGYEALKKKNRNKPIQ